MKSGIWSPFTAMSLRAHEKEDADSKKRGRESLCKQKSAPSKELASYYLSSMGDWVARWDIYVALTGISIGLLLQTGVTGSIPAGHWASSPAKSSWIMA